MAMKSGNTSTKTVSFAPTGPLPEMVKRQQQRASSEDEADRQADRLIHTLPPRDLDRLLQSQPMDPHSDDDSLDSSMDVDAAQGMGVITRTPDKLPDKNHNTRKPVPADNDSSDDSDDDFFGV